MPLVVVLVNQTIGVFVNALPTHDPFHLATYYCSPNKSSRNELQEQALNMRLQNHQEAAIENHRRPMLNFPD